MSFGVTGVGIKSDYMSCMHT